MANYANPYLVCANCAYQTTHIDEEKNRNMPCGCPTMQIYSICLSWSPVDGCTCRPHIVMEDGKEQWALPHASEEDIRHPSIRDGASSSSPGKVA